MYIKETSPYKFDPRQHFCTYIVKTGMLGYSAKNNYVHNYGYQYVSLLISTRNLCIYIYF